MTAVTDIVNPYLQKVRHSGSENLTALCPFHQEEGPSFCMNVITGLWLCYSCGAKGNLFTFLKSLGMSQEEIRQKHGSTIEEASKATPPPPDPIRPGLVAKPDETLPEDLLGLFHECPLALLDAGFHEATLQHFGIGFDKWHMRITYPLRDIEGQLVGISGRNIDEDAYSRYKIYRDEYGVWGLPTRDTDKRFLLWNAHEVFPRVYGLPRPEPVVLVEGFKACMWVRQSGIKNVVALMGNRMSWEQKWILQRMGGPVILMLDNNDRGLEGAEKISNELVKSLTVRFVDYDAEQPDEVTGSDLPQLVSDARDVHEVILQQGQ